MTGDRIESCVFTFLEELAANNTKVWFDRNRKRYDEELIEPVRAFVRDLGERMPSLSKHIVVSDKKAGGSLSRIFRDARFSSDKSPYHTHIALRFWLDGGTKGDTPGYFLRLATDGITLGTGIYRPDKEPLASIRDALVARTAAWKKAVEDPVFRKAWKRLGGESLNRPPKGYDAAHPAIEDLKRKDFVAFFEMKTSTAQRKGFAGAITERWAASSRLMSFLCRALDLPF